MNEEETKVVIINPFDDDASLEDGNICRINGGDNFCHGVMLIEYGLKTYGEDSIFGILSKGNYLPDVPIYFLVEENSNVVFLNISDKRRGKKGLLFIPSELSFEQEESLYDIFEGMEDFSVTVNSNMRIEDGIVCYDTDVMCPIASGGALKCPVTCNNKDCKIKKKA